MSQPTRVVFYGAWSPFVVVSLFRFDSFLLVCDVRPRPLSFSLLPLAFFGVPLIVFLLFVRGIFLDWCAFAEERHPLVAVGRVLEILWTEIHEDYLDCWHCRQ